MYFSIKYRFSDTLLKKKHKLHLRPFVFCYHTFYCVNMVSVTSASRYHPRYQSRSSVYIRGLIPRNFAELAKAVQIIMYPSTYHKVILRFILGAFVCVTTSMSGAKSSWHWSVIHNQVTFWAWFGNVYIVQSNALFCLFDLILYVSVMLRRSIHLNILFLGQA